MVDLWKFLKKGLDKADDVLQLLTSSLVNTSGGENALKLQRSIS